MDILINIVMVLFCGIGVISIIGVVFPLIGVIIYKIYRKIKYGASLYD